MSFFKPSPRELADFGNGTLPQETVLKNLIREVVRLGAVTPVDLPAEYDLPAWDDLRFPAQGINPPGAPSDPARNTATGLLDFSGTQDNVIAGIGQMPHTWLAGSEIRPHLHLRFPTPATANTRWKLEYDVADGERPFTHNSGTYTDGGTITAANPGDAKAQVLVSFLPIAMTGFKESSVVVWRITRLASSDAADNQTSIATLLEFDIHFRVGKFGTATEIPT